MNQRMWKTAAVLCILSFIPIFLNWRITTGFLIGGALAVLLYKRNESFWNDVVDTGHAGKHTGALHFLVNYLIMALGLLLGVFLPQAFNIFAIAAGLSLIKLAAVIENLLPQKKRKGACGV